MLTIRLQRIGKVKKPSYRLIVSEKGRDTHDRYLENLGTYNPLLETGGFLPNAERITYWIGKGATMSDTVNNLLIKNGVIKGEKRKMIFLSKKRKVKLAEKKKTAAAA